LPKTKVKVRCPQCGAKNDDVVMCRICGMSLPNAAQIRSRAGEGGPAFKENVEHERAAWRDYTEGRTSMSVARSRRPEGLPSLPPSAWADPAAYVAAGNDLGVEQRRLNMTMIGAVAAVAALILMAMVVL